MRYALGICAVFWAAVFWLAIETLIAIAGAIAVALVLFLYRPDHRNESTTRQE